MAAVRGLFRDCDGKLRHSVLAAADCEGHAYQGSLPHRAAYDDPVCGRDDRNGLGRTSLRYDARTSLACGAYLYCGSYWLSRLCDPGNLRHGRVIGTYACDGGHCFCKLNVLGITNRIFIRI